MATRRALDYGYGDKPDKEGGALGGIEIPDDDGTPGERIRLKVPGEGGKDGDLLTGGGDDDESGPVGNRTTAREMFATNESATPNVGFGGLPRGMTVQDASMGDSFGMGDTMDTPQISREPNPVASQPPNPGIAPPPSQGTMRRATSPGAASALFSDDSASPLFGRAGGLQDGGIAPFGGDDGGAPRPTQMMLQILRQLKQGR